MPIIMFFRIAAIYMFFIFTINLCLSNNLYHFSLPLFDEHGVKICNISGKQADLIDSKIFKVSDITIQFFSKGKVDPPEEIHITSDQANVDSTKNVANGDGFIAISNDEFSATGSNWQFFGNSKNFTLNKDVQVLFKKT